MNYFTYKFVWLLEGFEYYATTFTPFP